MQQTIVIGDLHGCLYELRDLMDKVGHVEGDRVVALGDFMDKGPHQAACVRYARENGFESVLGNHDATHLRWHTREKARRETGRPNKMRPLRPLDAAQHELLTEEDLAWLAGLPRTIAFQEGETTWVAVHGGFLPGIPIHEQDRDKLMYARWIDAEGNNIAIDYSRPETLGKVPEGATHWTARWEGENAIYGHEAFSLTTPYHTVHPKTQTECWGIDTGAVHGGRLTALIFPGRVVVQVKARATYLASPAYIPWTLGMREALDTITASSESEAPPASLEGPQ